MQPVDKIDSVLKLKGGQIWSVAPTATVYDAIEKMSAKGIGRTDLAFPAFVRSARRATLSVAFPT